MCVAKLDFRAVTPNKLVVVIATISATQTTGWTPWGTPVLEGDRSPHRVKVRTKVAFG